MADQAAVDEINTEERGTVACSWVSQVRQCLHRIGYYCHIYYFVADVSITPTVAKPF